MTAREYFGDWSRVLDIREADRVTRGLVRSGKALCPAVPDIFRAFRLCPLRSLRMVVLGQDPYPQMRGGLPVATGVAFANRADTPGRLLSPSLKILKDSVIDLSVPHSGVIFDPTLESWERQGVLMLNSALSCGASRAGTHALLWRPLIASLLRRLSASQPWLVYLLLGGQAQSFAGCVSRAARVFRCQHPSYLARDGRSMPSGLWRDINAVLQGQNGYGIKWFEEYGEQEDQERDASHV